MSGYPRQQYGGYQQPPPAGGAYQQPPSGGYQQYGHQQPPGYGGYPQGGHPGYGGPPPPAPSGPPGCPPGVDPTLYSWFVTVDADNSGQITAAELQQALTNSNWSHFNAETCRLMIGIFDHDNSGTIGLHEFAQLWAYINQWKGVFDRYDKDRSGNIDAGELYTAYNEMGFRVSMPFCQLIVIKFDRAEKKSLKFDDFIQSCVMLRSLTDAFRVRDTNLDGTIQVAYEDFMTMAISNKP